MERLKQDIKTGQFNRLYVLCGDDDYFISVFKKRLREALIPEDDSMNLTEYSGKGLNVNEIMDTARTIPFLAERRVVIVSDSGLLAPAKRKKKDGDEDTDLSSDDDLGTEDAQPETSKKGSKKSSGEYGLKEFFAEIPETTTMIFCEEKVERTSAIFKAAQKYGYIATFNRVGEKDDYGLSRIQGYVAAKLKRDNMNITNGAYRQLIERTGTDLRVIFTELEKLTCFALDKGVITEEDVSMLIPEKIEDRVYLLTEAMTNHNQKKALDLYYDLCQIKNEKPVAILAAIYSQYHKLYLVKKLSAEGVDYKEIMKYISKKAPSEYAYNQILRLAGKYTYDQLKTAMQMCQDYDKAFRTGKMKDNVAVEMVIVAMSSRENVITD